MKKYLESPLHIVTKLGNSPFISPGQFQIIPYPYNGYFWVMRQEQHGWDAPNSFEGLEKKCIGPAHECIMEVEGEKEKTEIFLRNVIVCYAFPFMSSRYII